jgi:hypothetical protein
VTRSGISVTWRPSIWTAAVDCSSGSRTAKRYDAQAHLLIGRIHLRAGRPREAIDALKISIWSEETTAARLALAEAYLTAKDEDSARTELERALVLDPQSEEARRLLGSLKVDPIK